MAELISNTDRFKELVSRKLGRCARCMRACAKGVAASCVATIVTTTMFPQGPFKLIAVIAALVVAACFTLLLLAHLGAVMVRSTRKRAEIAARENVSFEPSVGRRLAMVRMGQAAVATAVLGGSLFLPRKIAAQQLCNCQYGCYVVCHPGDTMAYDRCYCRDENGNSCGPGYTDTATGANTCPG
jgi:uncharacterized membrane protein